MNGIHLTRTLVATVLLIAAAHAPARAQVSDDTPRAGSRVCFLPGTFESEAADTSQIAEALFGVFSDSLEGAGIELVALPSSAGLLPTLAARDSACGAVLRIDLTQSRSSGGLMRRVLRESIGGSAPYPAGGGIGDALVQTVAARGVTAAADVALATRARDQFRFDYALTRTGSSSPLLSKSEKAKARRDGEDVLSPLVENAAAQVAAALAADAREAAR